MTWSGIKHCSSMATLGMLLGLFEARLNRRVPLPASFEAHPNGLQSIRAR
jgi:hypothetical protein